MLFQIRPTRSALDQAKKDKKSPAEQPKDALGIMSLEDGRVTAIDRVKSFDISDDAPGWAVYLKEPPAAAAVTGAPPSAAPSASGGVAAARPGARNRKEYGTDLVLRNLTTQVERTFADVLDYSFSRDGRTLVFSVSSRSEGTEGLFAVTPGAEVEPAALLAGKGRYTRISWDARQSQLAFLSDRDDAASAQPKLKLYRWDRRAPRAVEIAAASTPDFGAGMVISERGLITFSSDGSRVFFGVSRPPDPSSDQADAAAPADDKAVFDLWSWRDDFIQPMQKVRANQERNRSFRAVVNLSDGTLRQLADETMPTVTPSGDGRSAVGTDDRPYRQLVGVDANYADVYLVDTTDGSRRSLLRKHTGTVSWSPNGRWALYYRDRNWYSVSVPDGAVRNLTASLGVGFWQELYDWPSAAPSYGQGGWTRDDKYVLLNDRYDVWQVAADGSGAKNLTDGVGRQNKVILRHVRLDPSEPGEEPGIDPAKPLLFSAVSEVTRDEGFYRDRIDGGLPERLLIAAKAFGNPVKAKNADVVMLTQSAFNEFPDLMITTPEFKDLKKVTNANPQKRDLVWGTAELIRYKNLDGVPLSGILMKPEGFDPAKKYPMIVYIYERLSQGLHAFVNPAPSHSINASYYVSNGYLVLKPDIVYTIGYPGQSALNCVLPAVQAVVDQGFVDENAIGIQGHSWGGYQIAYMLTRTNRFRAAAPGAVVVNMTSAYSGIRWGTGLPRQFQYEHTQSRIGGTLWEYPMRFVENSALFQLDRVTTPVLTIHNDGDDAVPWYQGIEYYLGLRRLNKEVYFFSYNGEPHGLRRRANQKDYTIRLQQFFDHFLKHAPSPDWMTKGIPFLQKGKESGGQ